MPVEHDDLPEDGAWPEVRDMTIGCAMTVAVIALVLVLGFLIGLLRG